MLDKIGIEINNFSKMFPVEASLTNFTIFLNQQQKQIESFYPQVDQMDFYRFVHVFVCPHVLIRLREQESVTLWGHIPSEGREFSPLKLNYLF